MAITKPIAILGAGSWGTALALLLARNNQTTHLWSYDSDEMARLAQDRCNQRYLPDFPFPSPLYITPDLPTVLSTADDILIAVPSHGFRDTLNQIKPYIHANTRIAWATKGLDPLSNKLLHAVAEEILGNDLPLAAISGPSFAKEVADRVVFMDHGTIVEQAPPAEFFAHPASERARDFLDTILRH